jgi:hypothetical protein
MAMMCLNSPRVDETHIPQLKEIVALYNVDGFFLDNLLSDSCAARATANIGGRLLPPRSAAKF